MNITPLIIPAQNKQLQFKNLKLFINNLKLLLNFLKIVDLLPNILFICCCIHIHNPELKVTSTSNLKKMLLTKDVI